MESYRRHRRFYSSPSIQMQYTPSPEDEDALSLQSLNEEVMVGMDYLASNLLTLFPRHFHPSTVRHQDTHRAGWIINGSFFDEQIFQLACSSSILSYSNTPHDLNQFLQGHHAVASSLSSLNAHLFKLAFILTVSDGSIEKEALIDFYPQEDEIYHEIPNYKRFCFPELKMHQTTQILHEPSTYVFTRILSNGQVEYGYCRRVTKEHPPRLTTASVICLVSTYPYYKLYDGILNELSAAYLANPSECSLLIQSFYSKPIPKPTLNSSGIVCILNDRRVFFHLCPRDDRLNHDYFYTLLTSLSPQHIVDLFEAILSSKRVLLFSNSLSKLTKCCLALSFLIYPFIWPYSFVSLMPSSWLDDLLDSPCPYIYGCLSETEHSLPTMIDHDPIRIDLDSNRIEKSSEDIHPLPMNLRQTLDASLSHLTKFRLIKSDPTLVNIAVSEACLYVLVELFYLLPDYFQRDKCSLINSTVQENHFALCSKYFQASHDHPDSSSSTSHPETKRDQSRFDYTFRSEEFLSQQPLPSYTSFLKDFTKGMIFLKFLDDYQSNGEWNIFSQRLTERRQILLNHPSIHPTIRFRQTFDLLHKQLKQTPRHTDPLLSKLKKKFFQ